MYDRKVRGLAGSRASCSSSANWLDLQQNGGVRPAIIFFYGILYAVRCIFMPASWTS